MAGQVHGHKRENGSVLAPLEKRALIWLAHRLPDRVNSDHLSALGLLSMAAAGACFALWPGVGWAGPAIIAALILNWFGDSLDGTVARVRGQQRPRYGYYVDHVIDLAGTSFLLGGLALSGLMAPVIALALLAGYVLVCAETYLATHVTRVFKMAFMGFGPTELRIVLAAGVLKAMSNPYVELAGLGPARLFDIGGIVATIGLALTFVVSAIRNSRQLFHEEPVPARTVDTSSTRAA